MSTLRVPPAAKSSGFSFIANERILIMNKKISRIIAGIMFVTGVVFIAVALNNPQLSWPWSNTITYTIYLVYFVVMLVLLIAPLKKKK